MSITELLQNCSPKKPNQGSECMLKDYSENVGNVKRNNGCAVFYMLV
jgi:hypothetical protein